MESNILDLVSSSNVGSQNIRVRHRPRDRDFSRDKETLQKLLDMPYLLKGMDKPSEYAQRLELLRKEGRLGQAPISISQDDDHHQALDGDHYHGSSGQSQRLYFSDQRYGDYDGVHGDDQVFTEETSLYERHN